MPHVIVGPWGHVPTPSATSRAAKAVSNSAVTPAAATFPVASSSAQYSGGILSRCHHLETCVAVVPGNSAAMASREFPHSSMTARNEVKSDMDCVIGQSVLKRKAFLSLDCRRLLGQTVPMSPPDEKDQYRLEFIDRVRRARASTGKKQWEIALAMGLEQDDYKHFEQQDTKSKKGRVIPHYLIPRFCFACQVDPMWLLSGHGKMKGLPRPELVEAVEAPPARAKARKARAKRTA